MKRPSIVLSLAALLLLGAGDFTALQAAQEVRLGDSPDGRTRVIVAQRITRRVEDRVFFEYPVYLVDVKSKKRFEFMTASAPLVQERPTGTFYLHPESIQFEWNAAGDALVYQLEEIEGHWKTFLLDIPGKAVTDLTPDLYRGLLKTVSRKELECQSPYVALFKWMEENPERVVFKLSTVCSKAGEKAEKKKYSTMVHWVLYDTAKKKVHKDCVDCLEEKALKYFLKKPKPTPTPTPVEEQTPTN